MRVDWRPEAAMEIEAAADWYRQRRPCLRDQLLEAVAQAIQRVAANPYRSRVLYRDTRQTFVRRFPYIVYYRIHDGRILVVAFLHARRDPATWQVREPPPLWNLQAEGDTAVAP